MGQAHTRRYKRLSPEDRVAAFREVRAGRTYGQIGQQLGCTGAAVRQLIKRLGGFRPALPKRPTRALRVHERVGIELGLRAGSSVRAIARTLERAVSTVSREIAASGGRAHYCADRAEARAERARRRPKPLKLLQCRGLRRQVERRLAQRWSPEQISRRLRLDFPHQPTMRVSPETIYRSLFVQGRGALRRELSACLRSGRARRRPPAQGAGVGEIRDMVLISERPAEAADRAVPGHWEGDLLMGAKRPKASAIATLVERKTRFVMLCALPEGLKAEAVREALAARIVQLPQQLRRSLTWDRGKEMATHVAFTVQTGLPVYFCDPHSPWQRGSNENTNGLLRQYFPKGTDLSGYSQRELDAVARELNDRPRQTLNWRSPSEALAQVLR